MMTFLRNLAFALALCAPLAALGQVPTQQSATHSDAATLVAAPTGSVCTTVNESTNLAVTTQTPGANQSVWISAIAFDLGQDATGTTAVPYLSATGLQSTPVWSLPQVAAGVNMGSHWTEYFPTTLQGTKGTAVAFSMSATAGAHNYMCYRVYYSIN